MAFTANVDLLQNAYENSRPTTYDYLRPNGFRFTIQDLPHVSYTCQSANIPLIDVGFATQPTPFVDVPVIGDKVNFGDFTITFLINEDMANYLELYAWLVAIGFPKSYNQFPDYIQKRMNRFPFVQNKFTSNDTIAYSDATLHILNSVNVASTKIVFRDLFPISLQALDFNITPSTIEYFVGIASFKFKYFDVET
ncbi:hypothetical protein EBR43_04160 [bacterium]|nr:hypothetical protein [bacterium]